MGIGMEIGIKIGRCGSVWFDIRLARMIGVGTDWDFNWDWGWWGFWDMKKGGGRRGGGEEENQFYKGDTYTSEF